MVSVSAANLKMTLKFAVAPSPLNTLLEDVPVLSEALLNKPVDCVLLDVSGAWWFITFKIMRCPLAGTLYSCGGCGL